MSKLHELSVLGSSGAWRYYPLRIDCDSSASHDAIAWQYHASNGDDAAKIHNILVRVHKNNKKGAKYLEDKGKRHTFAPKNNGRVPFLGIGVSPIGRVVRFVATLFLCLLGWIDFEPQKFTVLHEYVGSQYVVG